LLKILLATNNKGKVSEYLSLLNYLPLELVTPAGIGISTTVAETGGTYEENACSKALAFARLGQMPSLADDSGLEVAALHNEPGVRSARYAGDNVSDKARVRYLLQKLTGVPLDKRTARFVCVIAVADLDGRVEICRGECSGVITLEPKGERGFGYDPVFFFPELNKTMAELTIDEKNRISHRGKAARKVDQALKILGLL
jgi:XTP/dITP diphosphohydrolase